jgi:adenylate kinase
MDKQSKLQYQLKVEKYLADNHVYDLFEDLLKNITVKQPDDPITYIIDKLSEPPSYFIFI